MSKLAKDPNYELWLKEKSLRRWKNYLKGSKIRSNQRKKAVQYVSKLEIEIDKLKVGFEEGKKTKVISIDEIFERIGEAVGDTIKGAVDYMKIKKAKNAYLFLVFLIFLFFFRKGSITGYTVVETITNNNVVTYFLLLVLGMIVLFYFKSD